MVGGLGICGRPFCCASFLDDFQPVSIKMAKTQNLSLNPTKISGTCGRLMCCLKYEQEAYEDLLRTSPKPDSFVDTPEGRGTVVEVDLLRQRVKVRLEDSPETLSLFANADIAVLRSGKARKNDPPIPADLAPISGSGKRPRPAEPQEQQPVLEPIRFRYSTESVVEEPEENPIPADLAPISGSGKRPRPAEPQEQQPVLEPIRFRYSTESVVEEPEEKAKPAQAENRRSRRRRQEAPKPQEAQPEKPEKPHTEGSGKPRRRPNNRRRRPSNPAAADRRPPSPRKHSLRNRKSPIRRAAGNPAAGPITVAAAPASPTPHRKAAIRNISALSVLCPTGPVICKHSFQFFPPGLCRCCITKETP